MNEYIAKEGEVAVNELVLELLIADGDNKEVNIPLNEKSVDLTYLDLERLVETYYDENLDTAETYGFTYRIVEG